MALTLTGTLTDGSVGAVTSQDITYPAYSTGDLVLCHIVTDNGTLTHTFPANGPNSETIVTIRQNHASLVNANRVVVSAFYWIATSNEVSGTVTVTASQAESYTAACARIPTGDFDSVTPIDSSATGGDSDNSATNAPSPSWTATSGAAGGLVVAWIGVDADLPTSTPAGWTDAASRDDGGQTGTLSERDTTATASEVIASANWPIAGDSSSSIGYVVNASGVGGGTALPLLNAYYYG